MMILYMLISSNTVYSLPRIKKKRVVLMCQG